MQYIVFRIILVLYFGLLSIVLEITQYYIVFDLTFSQICTLDYSALYPFLRDKARQSWKETS